MLSIACLGMLSSMACTTATRCPRAAVMHEPGINHLTDFALFLTFACIERWQLATSPCKAKTLELIDKTKKIGLYG